MSSHDIGAGFLMIIIVIRDPDCVRLVLYLKTVVFAIIYKCLILELHTAACSETFKCRKVMNLHPHAVLNHVLWRWYQSPSGFKPLRVF